MIRIDGGKGEGGGQILRTALSLSAWLQKPIRIERIRAGRSQAGLKAQHLASVRMVQQICSAEVEGAELKSRTLTFRPGELQTGTFNEEVGTAGATTLVAQAAAFPLFRAPGNSLLRIRGGTHVAWAPPLEYLAEVYASFLQMLGLNLRIRLLQHGFYPKGGGRIAVEVIGHPPGEERREAKQPPLNLKRPQRKKIRIETTAVVSGLQRTIAERMLKIVSARLEARKWSTERKVVESRGASGAYVFIRVFTEIPRDTGAPFILGGFTGLGEHGKPAEKVAEEAAAEAMSFLDSDASVDPRLADQVLLPAVLAGAEVRFKTHEVSRHLRTHADLLSQFFGPTVEIQKNGGVAVRRPGEAKPPPKEEPPQATAPEKPQPKTAKPSRGRWKRRPRGKRPR